VTKIDFYVMTGGDANDTLAIACRLTEKAFRSGTVYLHCVDKLQAATLQEKLWSFRPDAFIPHELSSEREPREAVVIGHKAPPENFHDILINLANETPAVFARFDRVLEIVPAEHSFREASRSKWRFYQDRGYPLEKHDINL
jgi:DNA polymerase III subunit chi